MTDQYSETGTQSVAVGTHRLEGLLTVPERAAGTVVFAHGSGSSRFSPRNTFVAERLQARGFATLLFDLLSEAEGRDRRNVFDIPLLAARVGDAVDWVRGNDDLGTLQIGLFGASTGAAAALVAAANMPADVAAIVSRGGRPDLADAMLEHVRVPTLLIVGGADYGVIELNEAAFARLACEKRLEIVPGATHLFEERGTLETVIDLAGGWFSANLSEQTPPTPGL
ncbi:MAG: alpha/beta hydrolase [Hyphomicrobiales bacterium]|nr:alpha/beta hydrolase [Hyphomicrobiales bacterium]